MENETAIEIQKHTEFLVEEYEHQLQKAAKKILDKYGLEPEDLDNPGEQPPDMNEEELLDWYTVIADWKFHIRIIHALTVEEVKHALDLHTGV